MQVLGEVPEGYGDRYLIRSQRFWCRYLILSGSFRSSYPMRFRKVPGQIPFEVPEGSGAETL